MFAGIIEELGVVKEVGRKVLSAAKGGPPAGRDQGLHLVILARTVLQEIRIGDSITVNGVCLTVVRFSDTEMAVELSPETLRSTTLGELKVGDGVNLERALRWGERIGGHLVTGHVDGVGCIRERRMAGDCLLLRVEAPADILKYCVRKGSIAVDGISLTINDLSDKDFTVMVIPHTARVTTLGLKGVGALVNLENDQIGKYVERLLRPGELSAPRVDVEYLRRHDLI